MANDIINAVSALGIVGFFFVSLVVIVLIIVAFFMVFLGRGKKRDGLKELYREMVAIAKRSKPDDMLELRRIDLPPMEPVLRRLKLREAELALALENFGRLQVRLKGPEQVKALVGPEQKALEVKDNGFEKAAEEKGG